MGLRIYENVLSYEEDDGQFSLENDVIMNTREEKYEALSPRIQSNLFEYDLMEEDLEERMKHVATSDQIIDS